ncbi:MAG: nucleoside triphosphate pyrophosphohydrolase [Gammaproteobacteria bacterium]|nr:nucleoside triphosphate pyrophosphohydrolase [Gammaproteobacteria bacterium]
MAQRTQIEQLVELMARLRDPDGGCPWDLEQNFESVAPYTIEEAYEVADAIERGALGELKSELGDLLFQVIFHARMAEEAALFNFTDVVESIVTKMTRRHPHVFGDAIVNSVAEQSAAWERLKREEQSEQRQSKSLLDGITRNLPAISRAEKLQRRVAPVGLDWSGVDGVIDKISEELGELQEAIASCDRVAMTDELGDLLFSCTNLARHLEIDGEQALRKSNEKFENRFRHVEAKIQAEGGCLSEYPEEILDELWELAKREV